MATVPLAKYQGLVKQYEQVWERCQKAESALSKLKKINGGRPKKRGKADKMTLKQTGGGFGYGAMAEGTQAVIYEVWLPNISLTYMADAFWNHTFIVGCVGAATVAIWTFIWKVMNKY